MCDNKEKLCFKIGVDRLEPTEGHTSLPLDLCKGCINFPVISRGSESITIKGCCKLLKLKLGFLESTVLEVLIFRDNEDFVNFRSDNGTVYEKLNLKRGDRIEVNYYKFTEDSQLPDFKMCISDEVCDCCCENPRKCCDTESACLSVWDDDEPLRPTEGSFALLLKLCCAGVTVPVITGERPLYIKNDCKMLDLCLEQGVDHCANYPETDVSILVVVDRLDEESQRQPIDMTSSRTLKLIKGDEVSVTYSSQEEGFAPKFLLCLEDDF